MIRRRGNAVWGVEGVRGVAGGGENASKALDDGRGGGRGEGIAAHFSTTVASASMHVRAMMATASFGNLPSADRRGAGG